MSAPLSNSLDIQYMPISLSISGSSVPSSSHSQNHARPEREHSCSCGDEDEQTDDTTSSVDSLKISETSASTSSSGPLRFRRAHRSHTAQSYKLRTWTSLTSLALAQTVYWGNFSDASLNVSSEVMVGPFGQSRAYSGRNLVTSATLRLMPSYS